MSTQAETLARLYNRAKPQGMGFLQSTTDPMTLTEAQELIDGGLRYVDYLFGRVMKVDLAAIEQGTEDYRLYDRDNGQGAARSALTGPGYAPDA